MNSSKIYAYDGRLRRLFENFVSIHHTKETEKVARIVSFNHYRDVCYFADIFNANITWSKTEEGYVYYYTLNLRWVFALTVLCHEICPDKEKAMLHKLEYYHGFSGGSSLLKDEKEQYRKIRKRYEKKIEKLKEIFGN